MCQAGLRPPEGWWEFRHLATTFLPVSGCCLEGGGRRCLPESLGRTTFADLVEDRKIAELWKAVREANAAKARYEVALKMLDRAIKFARRELGVPADEIASLASLKIAQVEEIAGMSDEELLPPRPDTGDTRTEP